jgi:putative serine protease PepD
MTQATGPRHNEWGAAWATTDPGGSPTAHAGPSQAWSEEPAPAQPRSGEPLAQTQQFPPPGSPAQYPGPAPTPSAPSAPSAPSPDGPPRTDGPPPAYPPQLPQRAVAFGSPAPAPVGSGPQPAPAQQPAPTQQLSTPPNLWAAPPPGGPGGYPPPKSREPRGPGWGGVVAVGAGAALLSSLLTAGVVSVTDHQGSSSSSSFTASTSQSQTVSPPVSGSSNSGPDWVAVANAVEPSVVSVQVSGQSGSGEGSGIILDTQGRVLTNNHVVADASGGGSITVVLHDGRLYPATVVGTDASTDLAVLQISNAPSDLKAAVLGNSSAVKVGDQVMAAGNPLGLSDTVTTGIVSAVNRPVTTSASEGNNNPFGGGGSSGEAVVTNAIQTDAAINPGNSGGALVDSQGRVIGITSSIASLGSSSAFGGSSQSGNIGLGFAIPINEAKDVASQLISSGKAQHAWLGITLSEDTVKVDGAQRQAAILRSVSSGTPADKAGLRSGDAVVAVNGVQVSGADFLVAQIRQFRPGTKVTLTIVRNGSTQQLDVTLGTKPNS